MHVHACKQANNDIDYIMTINLMQINLFWTKFGDIRPHQTYSETIYQKVALKKRKRNDEDSPPGRPAWLAFSILYWYTCNVNSKWDDLPSSSSETNMQCSLPKSKFHKISTFTKFTILQNFTISTISTFTKFRQNFIAPFEPSLTR